MSQAQCSRGATGVSRSSASYIRLGMEGNSEKHRCKCSLQVRKACSSIKLSSDILITLILSASSDEVHG